MSYVKIFLTMSCLVGIGLAGQEVKDNAYWRSYATHCDQLVESLVTQIKAQNIKKSYDLDQFIYKQRVNCAAAQFRVNLENIQKPTWTDMCRVFVYNPVVTPLYLWWKKKESFHGSIRLSFLESCMNKVVYDFLMAKSDKEKDDVIEKRAGFIYEFAQLARKYKNRS